MGVQPDELRWFHFRAKRHPRAGTGHVVGDTRRSKKGDVTKQPSAYAAFQGVVRHERAHAVETIAGKDMQLALRKLTRL